MLMERATVLVTVKAYPQLSRSYGETVCVAGLRVDRSPPTWMRLYPIPFRSMDFASRFVKYQLVELEVFRSTADPRPESYRPNLQSLVTGSIVSTENGTWRERWRYMDPLAGATTACQLLELQRLLGTEAPSIGLIKPREILDLSVEANDAFDDDRRYMAELAAAGDLLTSSRAPLEPAPFRLKYRYLCETSTCRGHHQTLIDWEAGQAARRWKQDGRLDDELPDLLHAKFLSQMCATGRDTYFYLGNQHQHPSSFLVLGLFWPPANSRPAPTLPY